MGGKQVRGGYLRRKDEGVEERSNEKDWISAGDRRNIKHKT
jgi:hypothetical protein